MTQSSKPYQAIDIGWLTLLGVSGTVIGLILFDRALDLSVFASGVLCVGLTAVGRREGYLIGLYNSVAYPIIAYENGLFGEVYLNLFFFLPTGIIGYLMWKRHSQDNAAVEMRRLSWRTRLLTAALCAFGLVALGYILSLNSQQNTPYIDATTNVLSVVATFLMMARYKEQWLLYIALNAVTIFMWTLRYLGGGNAGDMMILMWSLFFLNSIFGYWRWHVGAQSLATEEIEAVDKDIECRQIEGAPTV